MSDLPGQGALHHRKDVTSDRFERHVDALRSDRPLESVLEDQISGEVCLRLFMPVPTQPDSAAAALLSVIERIGDDIVIAQHSG